MYRHILILFSPIAADHPIHQPKKEDPFNVEMPESVECEIKMKQGVVYLYKDAQAVAADNPIEMPYPSLESFLCDMNLMYALISDGPL